MRIIAFGDIHMSSGEIRNIPGVETADLIILNGDLTNYGTRREAKKILNEILSINLSVFALIGNLDNYEINGYLDELNLNLHGQARLFKGKVCFAGIGRTTVINPGMFRHGGWIDIRINTSHIDAILQ
jgi:Icc-related predicted phosphoesterase